MPRFYDESEAQAQARDRWQAEYEASGYARMHNVHQGYVASNPEGVLRGQYDNTGGSQKTSDAGEGASYRPIQASSGGGAGSFLGGDTCIKLILPRRAQGGVDRC